MGDNVRESNTLNGYEVLSSAYEQATAIIEEANQSGEDLIRQKMEKFKQECLGEKENARKTGYAEGYAEGLIAGEKTGYQQGVLEAKENNEKYIEELLRLIARLEESRDQVIEEQQNHLTLLAISITEKILNQTLADDETKMCTMIRQALEQYQHQEWLKCYLSYGVFEALKNNDPEFIEKSEQIAKGIRFLPNKEMEDTDCVIELPTEVIDISIDTQLNKIKKVLSK
ncbi:MAG TPA: FliH/SctL family protein [Clostridiales bacterium]|nr:FliH/SctL family protein [Clostridiales bacterium]